MSRPRMGYAVAFDPVKVAGVVERATFVDKSVLSTAVAEAVIAFLHELADLRAEKDARSRSPIDLALRLAEEVRKSHD